MSSPGGQPRKFSEKIAIMERKLNEDEDAFSRVMREVRAITGDATHTPANATGSPAASPGVGLEPGQWNRPGGSLPNMHDGYQQYWPESGRPAGGGRSPPVHFHPYRSPPRLPDRVPPLHYPVPPLPPQHLLPPDQWNAFGRARSDPAINSQSVPYSTGFFGYGGGPVGVPFYMPDSTAPQLVRSYNGETSSPAIIPGGGEEGGGELVGSLPNMPQLPQLPGPSCYHTQVGQRHSTGCGGRLAPSYTAESQSAPTSPAALVGEQSLNPCWPIQRHYSNSPESLDIPNIVLTQADGIDGGRLDCFENINVEPGAEGFPYDLQDLRLHDGSDMQGNPQAVACNGSPTSLPHDQQSTNSSSHAQVYQ